MTDWPHAPAYRLLQRGTYMVTAGTYGKVHLLNDPDRLTRVQDCLFSLAEEYEWTLQAWAFLINHYHFVGQSPSRPDTLREMLTRLHASTGLSLNEMDVTPHRRVWYQYWDTLITNIPSYFARLHYVHQNPVRHGVVPEATMYRWCSAAWFERTASAAFRRTIESFKIDRVKVYDDF